MHILVPALFLFVSNGWSDDTRLTVEPLKLQKFNRHDFDKGSNRKAKENEPTLTDTLSLYLWIKTNNACALFEQNKTKRKELVDKALEQMKNTGSTIQKKAAERLLTVGVGTAAAYLDGVEKARAAASSLIAAGKTTFNKNYPDVFADQLLLEKSRGDIAVLPRGATEFAATLGGERLHSSDPKVEAEMRDNEQSNLDTQNAVISWSKALEKQ
ncbi:MAG: hypothetical protein HY537_14810 [Deltaproteobacteria bacterium]|nr:hypothetical protein [Deltaproteobacteria bacterium]